MVDFRFQRYWTKMGKNEQLRWWALSSCGNNMIIDVNDDDDGTKWSFCGSSGCDLDTTHTLCLEMQWNVANRSYHRVDMLLLAICIYMQSGPELSPCRVMSCHVVLATTEFFRFCFFVFWFCPWPALCVRSESEYDKTEKYPIEMSFQQLKYIYSMDFTLNLPIARPIAQ